MTLFVVDAAHVLAAAPRSLGLGAARRAGRFDLVRLSGVLAALAPGPVDVLWFDALLPQGEPRDLRELRAAGAVEVRLVPLRGGRQRHVEALVLGEVLRVAREARGELVLLAGDPRRRWPPLPTSRSGSSSSGSGRARRRRPHAVGSGAPRSHPSCATDARRRAGRALATAPPPPGIRTSAIDLPRS